MFWLPGQFQSLKYIQVQLQLIHPICNCRSIYPISTYESDFELFASASVNTLDFHLPVLFQPMHLILNCLSVQFQSMSLIWNSLSAHLQWMDPIMNYLPVQLSPGNLLNFLWSLPQSLTKIKMHCLPLVSQLSLGSSLCHGSLICLVCRGGLLSSSGGLLLRLLCSNSWQWCVFV